MRSRSPRRRGARLTLTMLIMLATLVLVPSSSSALSWCDEKLAPEPKTTGQGVDSVVNNQGVIDRIPPVNAPNISGKGLYEEYLVSGTTWFVIVESDDCFDEQRTQGWPFLYNILWGLARGIDMVAIEAFRFAIAPPLEELEELVVDVVENLRDQIWRPLLPAITLLGAVTLAWWGLIRKRAMLTVEGAVWMLAATTMGLWILYAPASFMGIVTGAMSFGENLMTSAVTNATDEGSDGRCIPGSPEIFKGVQEDDRDFVARQQSEYLYETLVCRPWLVGLLGAGPNAEPYAEAYAHDILDAQALTRTESIAVGASVDDDGNDEYYDNLVDGEGGKKEQFEEISEYIRVGNEDTELGGSTPVWNHFRGAEGGERTMAAVVGLAAAATGGALVLAGSVSLLVVKLGFLLLMLLSPIFLLIGIHPGWGRGVLLRWIELVLSLIVKAIMWMAILLILVLVLNVLLSSIEPYGLALVMMGALVVAVLKYKDAIWGTLTTVQLSGAAGAGSGTGGGYSAVRSQLTHGAMRTAGAATRKAGSLTRQVGGLAVKGAALGGGVAGVGAAIAAKKGLEHMRGHKIGSGQNPDINNAFSRMRERTQEAPDRHGRDAAEREQLVRQGGGAQRPTTNQANQANRSTGRTPRPTDQAPERQTGTGGRPAVRGETTGQGTRGDRRADQAPEGPRPSRPSPTSSETPSGETSGGTSGGGQPKPRRRPRNDAPPSPETGTQRRSPKGGRGGNT